MKLYDPNGNRIRLQPEARYSSTRYNGFLYAEIIEKVSKR
jgi:hypothetical protein